MFEVRKELIDYKDGDKLICVIGETLKAGELRFPTYKAGDVAVAYGEPYINADGAEFIKVVESSIMTGDPMEPSSRFLANFNGKSGNYLFVIENKLTDEDRFHGKLIGWKV